MLARCARCQGTFTTDRFGRQTCPHCGVGAPARRSRTRPRAAGARAARAAAARRRRRAPRPPARPRPRPRARGAARRPARPPGRPPPAPPPGRPPPGGRPAAPAAAAGAAAAARLGPWPELPAPFAERAPRGFLGVVLRDLEARRDPAAAVLPAGAGSTRPAARSSSACSRSPSGTVGAGALRVALRAAGALRCKRLAERMPPEQARVASQPTRRCHSAAGCSSPQVSSRRSLAFVALYVVAAVIHLLLMLFRGATPRLRRDAHRGRVRLRALPAARRARSAAASSRSSGSLVVARHRPRRDPAVRDRQGGRGGARAGRCSSASAAAARSGVGVAGLPEGHAAGTEGHHHHHAVRRVARVDLAEDGAVRAPRGVRARSALSFLVARFVPLLGARLHLPAPRAGRDPLRHLRDDPRLRPPRARRGRRAPSRRARSARSSPPRRGSSRRSTSLRVARGAPLPVPSPGRARGAVAVGVAALLVNWAWLVAREVGA